MGPEKFLSSGMWIIPLVMMVVCFFFFRCGRFSCFGGRGERRWRGKEDTGRDSSALSILKVRYAKGELTKEQYERMKADL